MTAPHPVLLDADVLAQSLIGDFLIWTAHNTGLFQPRWTSEIWEEAVRTQVDRLGWDPGIAERRREAALLAFPDSEIRGYESAISLCTNHPKDRHVLAAAIWSKTDTILTFNLKHFPPESTLPYQIEARHPGLYLVTLYELAPRDMEDMIGFLADRRGLSIGQYLDSLLNLASTFVARFRTERP